jgi:hypothetical protein
MKYTLGAFAGLLLVAGILATAMPALAYIGPGAGIGAIGTFFAVIGAVVLLIVGFLWYPIKRMLRRNKAPATAAMVRQPDQSSKKP